MYSEEQYEEFSKLMENKFPEMFQGQYGGFAVGPGWWSILQNLCEQIDAYTKWRNNTRKALLNDNPHNHKIPNEVQQVIVEQIKEKFGGLRFYYRGGDDHISGMVRIAESWAACTCEECGMPGKSRQGGWIRTLCNKHEEDRQLRYARDNGLEI